MKIGFLGLLSLLFIGLKLGHVIDWNWLWILSPLWISVAFTVALILFAFIIQLIVVGYINITK